MRLKLLRRRLTISAPRMKVRSAMPWPLRWAGAAIVLGFCAAISLWAFELGKDIAGVETGAGQEVLRLREDIARLSAERERIQSLLNTSGSAITVERDEAGLRRRRPSGRGGGWLTDGTGLRLGARLAGSGRRPARRGGLRRFAPRGNPRPSR